MKRSGKKNRMFREWLRGAVEEGGESEEVVMKEYGIGGKKEDWELVGNFQTREEAEAAAAAAAAATAA